MHPYYEKIKRTHHCRSLCRQSSSLFEKSGSFRMAQNTLINKINIKDLGEAKKIVRWEIT